MDFSSSNETQTEDLLAAVAADSKPVARDSKTVDARAFDVVTDNSRDALLTEFGKDTLTDRYLLPGENYQDLFARVASAYADDQDHAQRVYDYISKLWFMPATPVLSNGGTGRGLPISCYLNSVSDSLNGIVDTWNENVWLASKGGGIGTYWGAVRGIGEPVGLNGKTSGIIPFVRVMDSLTLAISQGSLRRGSAAVYLDISHPEIEEFLEIRKPSGDFNRKALNLHHGVLVTDEWMRANGLIATIGATTRIAELLADRHHAPDMPAVVVARTTERVGAAIATLQAYGISQLPVSEDAEGDAVVGLVGSISERGLLERAFRDPTVVERTVGEVMDPPLPLVEASASLDEAFALLSGGAPALVAVRGDRAAGVVTKLDFLEYLAHRPSPGG